MILIIVSDTGTYWRADRASSALFPYYPRGLGEFHDLSSGARMSGILNWVRGRKRDGAELGGVDLGERPWLVLGGGGVKGLAHLGAWEILHRAGFEPEGIVGTSIGALIGACLAGGQSLEELEELAVTVTREEIARMPRRLFWAQGIRSPALYRGDVFMSYIERLVPSGGWNSLRKPLQMNAVELGSGRTEWFGTGARTDVSLPEAIYASSALPVFYPPCPLPGGLYVDGGTEEALPLGRAAEVGATGIVAVDVGRGETTDAAKVVEHGMLAIHERVFSIMSGRHRRRIVAEWRGPPLLYIRPAVDQFGALDFRYLDQMIDEGRKAAQAALGAAQREAVRG